MSGPGGRGVWGGAAQSLALLLPSAAWASAGLAAALSGPAALEKISAGRVEIVSLEPAARGVEERELVLSLDGGKTFPLRLTGEIGPGDREAWWRVPALPTAHAVLALREGREGSEEEIVAVSAEFAILADPGLPAEEFCFRDGEWKTREADAGHPGLPAPSMGEAGPDRCEPLDALSDAFEAPVRALSASPSAGDDPAGSRDLATPAAGPPPVPSVPLFLPRRE